jgi:hypothetical protein
VADTIGASVHTEGRHFQFRRRTVDGAFVGLVRNSQHNAVLEGALRLLRRLHREPALVHRSWSAGQDRGCSVMLLRFVIASLCLFWPLLAKAETMLTSYYRAKDANHAAHRTLAIGTQLMLTNPRNGRTARVTISGRGPFIRGRALDISHSWQATRLWSKRCDEASYPHHRQVNE